MADADGDKQEEVRLSVVLYGGVSLAVYISGVCMELLNFVRATGPRDPSSGRSRISTTQVYRAAASVMPHELDDTSNAFWGAIPENDDPTEVLAGRPARRHFVVDILSGSSAGGLNAIFLSRALTQNGSLDSLRDVWVTEGGFGTLLNDEHVTTTIGDEKDGLARLLEATDVPRSLLSGNRFYLALLHALRSMGADADPANPRRSLVDALDCFITSTNLDGIETNIELASQTITEKMHRVVSHLVYAEQDATGVERDDFAADLDEFLAFVGRSTAAHPAAFYPANIQEVADLLDKQPPGTPRFDPGDARWPEIMRPSGDDITKQWLSDGGDMDNKPFSYVLDPVRSRRSVRPVDRKVLYVEPSPSTNQTVSTGLGEPPSILEYTVGAFNLGRTENIRDDIAEIDRRNAVVEDLGETMRTILNGMLSQATKDEGSSSTTGAKENDEGSSSTTGATWRDFVNAGRPGDSRADEPAVSALIEGYLKANAVKWVAKGVDESYELPVRSYEIERARKVVRELADLVVAMAKVEPRSVLAKRIRERVTAFLDGAYLTDPTSTHNHRRLLVDFDVRYRLRRLGFIDQILSQSQRRGSGQMGESDLDAHLGDVKQDELRTARAELNEQFVRLRAYETLLRGRQAKTTGKTILDGVFVEKMVADLDPFRKAWTKMIAEAAMESDGLDEIAQTLPNFFDRLNERGEEILAEASVRSRVTIGRLPEPFRGKLQILWSGFGTFDIHLITQWEETQGEVDVVQVLRVSPLDATSIINFESSGQQKLGGDSFSHFGGFFDKRWRQLDFMWGRLDAAEILLKALVPGGDAGSKTEDLRNKLIERANREILSEERAVAPHLAALSKADTGIELDEQSDPENVLKALKRFDVDLSFRSDPERAAQKREVLSRSAPVVGRMLGGAIGKEKKHREIWARSIGRLVQAAVEFAAPLQHRTASGLAQGTFYTLILAGIAGLVLSVVAPILGTYGLVSLAVAAAGTVGLVAGTMLVWLVRRRGPLFTMLRVVGIVLLGAWVVLQSIAIAQEDSVAVNGLFAVQLTLTSAAGFIIAVFGGLRSDRAGRVVGWSVALAGFALTIVAAVVNWPEWRYGALGLASVLVIAVLLPTMVGAAVLRGLLDRAGEPPREDKPEADDNTAHPAARVSP